jgi:hypothetical protein
MTAIPEFGLPDKTSPTHTALRLIAQIVQIGMAEDVAVRFTSSDQADLEREARRR